MWISGEDEVVQDIGAHGDPADIVWVLLHCYKEAMEPLRQDSKGILNNTTDRRQPVAVCAFSLDL